MNALSVFKTYWAANNTLNTALPVTRIYVGDVPPKDYPYARFTVIGKNTTLMSGSYHIVTLSFQLAVFSQNLNSLATLVETIDSELHEKKFSDNSMVCLRVNDIPTGETIDGKYTYNHILQYQWGYTTTGL